MRVRWSPSACADLVEAIRFIAEDDPGAARRMRDRLQDSVRLLRDHPEIGRMVPEIADPGLRERIVPPYRVVYTLRPGEVVILAVVHSRRQLPAAPDE